MKMNWRVFGIISLLSTALVSGCFPAWKNMHNGHYSGGLGAYNADIWYTSKELWEYQNSMEPKRRALDEVTANVTEGGRFTIRVYSQISSIVKSDWRYEVIDSDGHIIISDLLGYGTESVRREYDHDKGYWKTWPATTRKLVPLTKSYEGTLTFKLYNKSEMIERKFEMGLPNSTD